MSDPEPIEYERPDWAPGEMPTEEPPFVCRGRRQEIEQRREQRREEIAARQLVVVLMLCAAVGAGTLWWLGTLIADFAL